MKPVVPPAFHFYLDFEKTGIIPHCHHRAKPLEKSHRLAHNQIARYRRTILIGTMAFPLHIFSKAAKAAYFPQRSRSRASLCGTCAHGEQSTGDTENHNGSVGNPTSMGCATLRSWRNMSDRRLDDHRNSTIQKFTRCHSPVCIVKVN
jgi:hypothetical protein